MSATLQLADASSVIRLSLHVLAACVWLGGQIVLAGLLPTLRGLGEDAPRRVAAAFGRLSWPAYWLLVLTGFWNYAAVHGQSASSSWNTVFALKMLCVVLAGVIMRRAERQRGRAFDRLAQPGEKLFHTGHGVQRFASGRAVTSTPSAFHFARMSSFAKKPSCRYSSLPSAAMKICVGIRLIL